MALTSSALRIKPQADGRPRVFIRALRYGFGFRHSPQGLETVVGTRGEAFEQAMMALGEQPVVVIYGDYP